VNFVKRTKKDELEWNLEVNPNQSGIVNWIVSKQKLAQALQDEDPEQAVQIYETLLDYLNKNVDLARLELGDDYDELVSSISSSFRIVTVRELLQIALSHVIALKSTALIINDTWDHHRDLDIIRLANNGAKEKVLAALQIVREEEIQDLQAEVLRVDDDRAFAYRASRARISQARVQIIADAYAWETTTLSGNVFVFGSCEVISGNFVYGIIVKNNTDFVITDVNITVIAYPEICTHLSGDRVKTINRIEGQGFRAVKFIFHPTKDCVDGKIVCIASYIDHHDHLHSIGIKPHIIESVCDLLKPQELISSQFELQIRELISNNRTMKLELSPENVFAKASVILPHLNFYLVDAQKQEVGNKMIGTLRGFALGKYTGKRVAVTLEITGSLDTNLSVVEVKVAGDDAAMLPTTIEELAAKIKSWMCTKCGAGLNPDEIMQIGSGTIIRCRYCGHSLSAEFYCKSESRDELANVSSLEENSALLDTDEAIQDSIEQSIGTQAIFTIDGSEDLDTEITALRGCEIVGGVFEYKVKISNDDDYVITNVTSNIVAYPRKSLELTSVHSKSAARIEMGGFRTHQFSFRPTQDCVEGKIMSVVSFIDSRDKLHAIHVKPYTIRSVCDLLQPMEITTKELELILADFESMTEEQRLEWNAQVLFKKAEWLLPARNFFVVSTEERTIENDFVGIIRGFAKGKYTKNRLALTILITGSIHGRSATVKVEVIGEEVSMFPTAIEEINAAIDSWICLTCGAPLSPQVAASLKSELPVLCNHCGCTLTLDLFKLG